MSSDGDTLQICFRPARQAARPTEFSASRGPSARSPSSKGRERLIGRWYRPTRAACSRPSPARRPADSRKCLPVPGTWFLPPSLSGRPGRWLLPPSSLYTVRMKRTKSCVGRASPGRIDPGQRGEDVTRGPSPKRWRTTCGGIRPGASSSSRGRVSGKGISRERRDSRPPERPRR